MVLTRIDFKWWKIYKNFQRQWAHMANIFFEEIYFTEQRAVVCVVCVYGVWCIVFVFDLQVQVESNFFKEWTKIFSAPLFPFNHFFSTSAKRETKSLITNGNTLVIIGWGFYTHKRTFIYSNKPRTHRTVARKKLQCWKIWTKTKGPLQR